MSGFFDDNPEGPRRRPGAGQQQPRSRALLGTVLVLVALFFLSSVFTGIWTDRLWFKSVGYSAVFSKILGTRVLLFLVFGVAMALVVGANLVLAYRYRPLFRPTSPEQASLDRYRDVVDPLRRWLLVGVTVVVGLFAGASGAGEWRTFLLWRHRQTFGNQDPYFHKDIGFYVFELPWLHYLVNVGMAITVVSLIAAALVHYLFGGIRLQAKRDKLSGAAQVQISLLLGLFVLFKAFDYHLDRFDVSTSGGLFTGIGYTDQHAVLPAKNILTFIALICAVLFIANVFRRTWLLPGAGLALLALSSILLGAIWPGIVQQFQVRPSEPDREGPYIGKNIEATRAAFKIDDTQVTTYDAKQTLSKEKLLADAKSIPGIRLLDPARVDDTFTQLQQVRGYYTVAPVLDVDRYPVNGQERDMVLAVRELDQSGLPDDQRNWNNDHTVYTHGYGVIAAYGNMRDANGVEVTDNEGKPVWAEKNIPPTGELSAMSPGGYQPRIYFGERSPSYSIVGKVPGGQDVELDTPEGKGGKPSTNTYDGKAGVPVGGIFNKVLYAMKFSDANIVLSKRVNQDSKILYDRQPRIRLQKVAPWLTVDGDPYPAVVDGRVKWILDAYTTTDRYPNSEKRSLSDMTSDAINPSTQYATLPSDNINYMRNSVKAVVDAYDGSVTLYAWDSDPILKAWQAAFPGVVKPKSSIPTDLLAHMRYPEDMFKVQREMLATYHVTDPKTFYEGSEKWQVPQDPENKQRKQPPYRLSVKTPGSSDPVFSLTSVFTPNKRQNLAAFISVDADGAKKDYGTLRVLQLPSNTQIPGPSQIANNFGQDADIQNRLVAFTKANAEAIYGNLLTLPVGDGLLYVQPLYAQRESGDARYPALRYVLVSFGEDVGVGTTLDEALNDVLGIKGGGTVSDGGTTTSPGGGGGTVPDDVRSLLRQAEKKFAEARSALADGDLNAYAKAQDEARALVERALKAADAAASASPSPSPSPSTSPSPSPSASPSTSNG